MINNFLNFLKLIVKQRSLILSMAKREVASRYIGSMLGFIWNFINPLVLIGVFWFVFSMGFKIKPVEDVPFVIWFTAGLAVWNLFSEIVGSAPGAVVGYTNLIKKTIFPSQILPFVKIISCLITHIIYILILLGLFLYYEMDMSLYFFQAFYYLFCMVIFTLGLSWAVSSLNVFLRDVGQMITVILQVGFWATPIFWNIDMMPERFHVFIKINPMFYIVQGYRDSFIAQVPFWEHPYLTLYFWVVSLLTFVGGAFVFKQLKPQFADVL